jgi:hydroxyacylglutathione hydrolase
MKIANYIYCYPEMGSMDCNTYVFTGQPGIIIDPGNAEFLEARVAKMRKDGLDIKKIGLIVNTHLHIDHCSANQGFKELSGAQIGLLPIQEKNRSMVTGGAELFGMAEPDFKADRLLDGPSVSAGGTELELYPAPGHSPDCVCFYHRPSKVLVCGDVLFETNTGRVDLPGGDADALKMSIEALSRLDIELLLPGHMGIVSGSRKVQANFEYIRDCVFPSL